MMNSSSLVVNAGRFTHSIASSFEFTFQQIPADKTNEPFERLLIAKQFHGDLEATSKLEMLGS
jgi:hypothetical protein